MLTFRELHRDEIESVWNIDRREVVDAVYYNEGGALVLKPEHWDIHGWPPGEPERYAPHLLECFDQGGTFIAAFEGETLVGAAILENQFISSRRDQLQLKFLHISQSMRKTGLGRRLFDMSADKARALGAKRLYISATPSENTINFYLHLGCKVTAEIDPELFEMEPDDIHLEYAL